MLYCCHPCTVCVCVLYSQQPTLQPHEREKIAVSEQWLNTCRCSHWHCVHVQLETCLLESQNKAFYLQKEVGLLREQLQERDSCSQGRACNEVIDDNML